MTAETPYRGRLFARAAKIGAKQTPEDVGFRVVIWSEPKFIPGRGWMRRELQPEPDDDDPNYAAWQMEPPDHSPEWQRVPENPDAAPASR